MKIEEHNKLLSVDASTVESEQVQNQPKDDLHSEFMATFERCRKISEKLTYPWGVRTTHSGKTVVQYDWDDHSTLYIDLDKMTCTTYIDEAYHGSPMIHTCVKSEKDALGALKRAESVLVGRLRDVVKKQIENEQIDARVKAILGE